MAGAEDYQVYFKYGATSYPYTAASPHRGNDRCNKRGVPVVVAGTQIGIVGATGKVYDSQGNQGTDAAAHLHTQEWLSSPANTRKPQNEFKPGKVVAATSSSDFGNYVTIQNSDGWNTSYCHLDRIDVKVGQEVGMATDKLTPEEIAAVYQLAFDNDDYPQDIIKAYTGQPLGGLLNLLLNDPSYQAHKRVVNNPPTSGFTPYSGKQLFTEDKK